MTYEQFDRMLEKHGNAMVELLTKKIVARKLTIEKAANKAAAWHVRQMRAYFGGRLPSSHYQAVYTDLYKTGLHDFPFLVARMEAGEPPIIPRYDAPLPMPELYENTTSSLLAAARKSVTP